MQSVLRIYGHNDAINTNDEHKEETIQDVQKYLDDGEKSGKNKDLKRISVFIIEKLKPS